MPYRIHLAKAEESDLMKELRQPKSLIYYFSTFAFVLKSFLASSQLYFMELLSSVQGRPSQRFQCQSCSLSYAKKTTLWKHRARKHLLYECKWPSPETGCLAKNYNSAAVIRMENFCELFELISYSSSSLSSTRPRSNRQSTMV
jgi:hypothetical protein